MEYGICLIASAAMRAEKSEKSEMVNQLLFGDRVEVLESKDVWLHVKNLSDGYQGWINAFQVELLSQEQFADIRSSKQSVSVDLVQLLENTSSQATFLISAGSTLYNEKEGSFELLGNNYKYHGNTLAPHSFIPEYIIKHAMLFLHIPYLWGGRSAMGLDCSGFTQLVYKMAGFQLPRDASLQVQKGENVHLINEAIPGDLLFFDNQEQEITHVGILLDESHIIHAHNWVRIDKVDHHGIFNVDQKKYSHKLRIIKRYS